MPFYLYDDARARQFEPFALTRPVSELCAGALITRHRWARVCGEPAAGVIVADHLRDFIEFDSAPAVSGVIPAGARIVNSRCLPSAGRPPKGDVWVCDGRVAAVRLAAPLDPATLADGSASLDALAAPSAARATVAGWWVDDVWDYIRDLHTHLTADIAALAAGAALRSDAMAGATVVGSRDRLFVERDAIIEPHTIFDLTAGPVLVRRGATVQAFTRVVGPCVLGEGSVVVGDRIAASSIGERCRVHGELSMSIVMGCTNKSHDGFVGHSYLGRWVNLGAGTITSNLKNTYGSVQLWTPDGVRETGETFLGSFIGDYARTGIGTRLTTGTVIGAGANIFPTGVAPKVIPAFAWGDREPFATFELAKFLEVAERQMARRTVMLSTAGHRYLTAAHMRAAGLRGALPSPAPRRAGL
jgi:UDP-N-acetylglucosamine diphosphorylase / glucose-1-phosphate thymidylyltransferase / UDP-N-acetylgalactosamine diphosphorylase / glucosamine-1-phosphate N-acetyltransferase / galactosamine-1-phosphate N-acetyltransferase